MKELIISRIDYKNPTPEGGFPVLPALHDIHSIEDPNEIFSITCYFDTMLEAEKFAARFPKSYKFRAGIQHDYSAGFTKEIPKVSGWFRVNNTNKVTGNKNETAAKKLGRFIAEIKNYLSERNQ